jgi:hypothetical protein
MNYFGIIWIEIGLGKKVTWYLFFPNYKNNPSNPLSPLVGRGLG